ncbi:MAG: hypothetical protein SOH65_09285 [Bifidobacterium sp.]
MDGKRYPDRDLFLGKIRTKLPSLVLIPTALFYIFVASRIGMTMQNGGPDENMRALLPLCMVKGNWLPSGYDACAVYNLGNWSYAFYPQFIGAYLSAVFMLIAKTFGCNADMSFEAGRLASVTFSIICLSYIGKTVTLIFHRSPKKYLLSAISILILAFWPQYAFLSSYMNNDIVAFAGVALMLYALTSGVFFGWTYKSTAPLSAGIIISALGYWNSYGFILVSIIIFVITVFRQNRNAKARGGKLFAAASIPPALFIIPFFIVNLVRYHDLLGLHTFRQQYLLWLAHGGAVLQHPWSGSLRSLFLDTNFIYNTMQSFIGNLGYQSVPLPYAFCLVYLAIIFTGLGLFLSSGKRYWSNGNCALMIGGVFVASAITTILFIIYTVNTDVQPQGRYVIYLLAPLVLMVVAGLGNAFSFDGTASRVLLGLSLFLYVLLCLAYFINTIHFYGWTGVTLHV